MKVVLLLAGKGTRFLPLTETTPKPLIPVGGAPVLAHILASLKQLVIDELILVTGHLSDQIAVYMGERYDGSFRIIKQDSLDGTGGAVYAARHHIDCPVLVVFGDTIFDADLTNLNGNQSDNVIWTRTVEDYQRFGIVQTDKHGNMMEIIEKPHHDVGRSANIGLYYIADYTALLAGLDRVMANPPINGEYYFTYALNDMVMEGHTIKVVDVNGWHDCGNLKALIATNGYLLTHGQASLPNDFPGVTIVPPVLIQEGAVLHDCEIGPNVTIETGSQITACKISNTIVGENCRLGNVVINGSLVGKGEVLSGTKIEGCIVANGRITKTT
jgi:glucose-1-phosphate thymidylyltransferase